MGAGKRKEVGEVGRAGKWGMRKGGEWGGEALGEMGGLFSIAGPTTGE